MRLCQSDIPKQERLRISATLEFGPDQLAAHAVGAVAPDQPIGADGLRSFWTLDNHINAVRILTDVGYRPSPAHFSAQFTQPLSQPLLDGGLRRAERIVSVWPAPRSHVDVSRELPVNQDVDRLTSIGDSLELAERPQAVEICRPCG